MKSFVVNSNSDVYMEPDKVKQTGRSTQDICGISRYSDSGIFRFRNGKYGRCYRIDEANYNMEDDTGKEGMLTAYCDFLNHQTDTFKLFFYNRQINEEAAMKEHMYEMQGDPWDHVRQAYNSIFSRVEGGKEGVRKERYVVAGNSQKRESAVRNHFRLRDDSMRKDMNKMRSTAAPLSGDQWLRLLHSIFHPGQESSWISATDNKKMNFRNQIAPMYLVEKEDYLKSESKYYRVLTIKTLPSGIPDDILYRIADFDAPGFITVDYAPMPSAEGKELLAKQNDRNEQEIEKQQKVRNKQEAYSSDISRPIQNRKAKLNRLMKALDQNDDRIYFLNILIVVMGNGLEELERATEQVMENVSECGSLAETLYMQQMEGLVSALPVPLREVRAMHGLLTQAAAAFFPFAAIDLNVKNGIYYGQNQITDRPIFLSRSLDRDNIKNGHEIIFAPSGSGKSLLAKSGLVQAYLRYPEDHFYIIDPQGEYDNIVALAGGEIFRFAPGSVVKLNPFSCDFEGKTAGEIEDVIHSKESLAWAMLGLADGTDSQLGGVYRSTIVQAVQDAYAEARKTGAEVLPEDIRRHIPTDSPHGAETAMLWDTYCTGLLRFFNGHSNIDSNARVVSYNLHNINESTRPAVMMVLLEVLEDKVKQDYHNHIASYMVCDELDNLTALASTQDRLTFAWKLYRKLNCQMSGMLQNMSIFERKPLLADLKENTSVRILTMLNGDDLRSAQNLLKLTDAEMSYIQSNSEQGTGLLVYGSKHIAYRNQFSEEDDALLFDLFDSDPDRLRKRIGKAPKPGEDNLFFRLAHEEFSEGQLQQLKCAIQKNMPEERIMDFFHAYVNEEEMKRQIESYGKL